MATHTQKRSDNDEQVISTGEKIEQLHELIDDMAIAMMTTINTEGALVSRPMATQRHQRNGKLWFMTNGESHKLEELESDPRVNLGYYKDRTREYVSVSGTARITRDRAMIRERTNPTGRRGWAQKTRSATAAPTTRASRSSK
jgi:general stress protein 26